MLIIDKFWLVNFFTKCYEIKTAWYLSLDNTTYNTNPKRTKNSPISTFLVPNEATHGIPLAKLESLKIPLSTTWLGLILRPQVVFWFRLTKTLRFKSKALEWNLIFFVFQGMSDSKKGPGSRSKRCWEKMVSKCQILHWILNQCKVCQDRYFL